VAGTRHRPLGHSGPLTSSEYQLGTIGAILGGRGIVDENEIPHQSWAAEKKKENFANRLTLDPEIKCYLPGVRAPPISLFLFKLLAADESRDCLRIQNCQPVEAGPSDWVGTEVWGTGGDVGFTQDGSHAGLIAVAESAHARRPAALDQAQAASVGVAFVAGWKGLADYAGLKRGEDVAIVGVSGWVGGAVTQLARGLGAIVSARLINSAAGTTSLMSPMR
jgi:hypothetical protein